eukprot:4918102-Pleurochrysis_carterae.AAC.1
METYPGSRAWSGAPSRLENALAGQIVVATVQHYWWGRCSSSIRCGRSPEERKQTHSGFPLNCRSIGRRASPAGEEGPEVQNLLPAELEENCRILEENKPDNENELEKGQTEGRSQRVSK